MQKFTIDYSEKVHYLSQNIEAESIEEAIKIFYEKLECGFVTENTSELLSMKIYDEKGNQVKEIV
jgi:hypothetical protein